MNPFETQQKTILFKLVKMYRCSSHWSPLTTNNVPLPPPSEILILHYLYAFEKNQWLAFWGQIRRRTIIKLSQICSIMKKGENIFKRVKVKHLEVKTLHHKFRGQSPVPTVTLTLSSWTKSSKIPEKLSSYIGSINCRVLEVITGIYMHVYTHVFLYM